MDRNGSKYAQYLALLKRELIPALGCTEPIAVAYAAARAVQELGCPPESLIAECSGNIIKNVKSVIVPKTGNLKGIEAAAILGALGGAPEKGLEVLEDVTPEDVSATRAAISAGMCEVRHLQSPYSLHIRLTACSGGNSATVEICGEHTHIVTIEKNGTVVFSQPKAVSSSPDEDWKLQVEELYDFACSACLEDVKPILERQIRYNSRIAQEGLEGSYGANVGKTLLECAGDTVAVRARAWAAAGSDARMSGCTLPVVINSGSGNQGMTVSLPVLQYAQELHADEETTYRALLLSNLMALYQKQGIGRLSAYCGAVCAAAGAGAGIAYLYGEDLPVIEQTVVNTLANVSGIVCDGAKASCAAKISSAVEAALLGYQMAARGRGFHGGDGIVKNSFANTVDSVCRLGREGMRETDTEILDIMIHNP